MVLIQYLVIIRKRQKYGDGKSDEVRGDEYVKVVEDQFDKVQIKCNGVDVSMCLTFLTFFELLTFNIYKDQLETMSQKNS